MNTLNNVESLVFYGLYFGFSFMHENLLHLRADKCLFGWAKQKGWKLLKAYKYDL